MSTRTAKHEGLPSLSVTQSALTMASVSTGPALAPMAADTRVGASGGPGVIGALLAVLACLAVQGPLLAREPIFVLVTSAAVASLVALGAHLISVGERIAGWAFALGGMAWVPIALDGYSPWGPIVAWSTAGLPYVALSVGIFRYRRHSLDRQERFLPFVALLLTSGVSVLTVPFVDIGQFGFPPDTWWPAPWADVMPSTVVAGIYCGASLVLACYFVALNLVVLRRSSRLGRRYLRPMLIPGALLAVGSAVVQVISSLRPDLLGWHAGGIVTGLLVVCFTCGFWLSRAFQRAFGTQVIARLPSIRTPETVTAYVREVISDPSAELLYWSAEDALLLDEFGRRREFDCETSGDRFTTWIRGGDGQAVALLTAASGLGQDPASVDALVRVVSIIAENSRLNVLLLMRVAQLTATRTAEELAFTKAREQFHRDLHDGLQQTIASARMELEGLHDHVEERGRAALDRLESTMATALSQVHSLKQGKAPPELSFGLKPAIERAASELRIKAQVTVTDAPLGVLTLPVYYLVRESLTNVHKHAKAGLVEICVESDGRTVEVVVVDDGRGGATLDRIGGIGGMRRRVGDLGGVLTLDSPPSHGTTLKASIPCVLP